MTTRRYVLYGRISVSSEESVSLDRQIESGRQYVAARGGKVVGVFIDDGVSASRSKPEDRAGWRALLDSTEKFDAVVVWKVDRLARRVLDFLNADAALRDRKAGIVAVEDPVDMTTSQGRAFATMLAVFAQMEAEAISARVRAARAYLIREGRVVGGTVPFGWRAVPNPSGKGLVLDQDPDQIGYVREMVKRVRRGGSIYSVKQWLDEAGVPTPTWKGTPFVNVDLWAYSTIERLLRNPVLAGRTAFNPGNESKVRGLDLLRGADGLPVVGGSGIMTGEEWRSMVKALDERDSAQSLPRALRAKTSPLLSGLMWCALCDTRMHRGTLQGRHGYYCPTCQQAISNFEPVVVGEFLRQKGEHVRWSVVEDVAEGGEAMLPEIEQRLDELVLAIRQAKDRTEREELQAQMGNLLDLRDEKRAEAPVVVQRFVRHTHRGTVVEAAEDTGFFAEDWAAAETPQDQRDVLDDAITRIWVKRGRRGRSTAASVLERLRFDWKMPADLGPLEQPDDATLAAWAQR